MRTKTRKTLLIGLCALLCASVVAVVVIIMTTTGSHGETACMTINGDPVYAEEMKFYLSKNRASTAQHFTVLYDLEAVGADFWSTDFDGITPNRYLLDKAVESLRYDRAFFADCARMEGQKKVTFASLKEDMQQENQKRADSVTDSGIFYGVTEYSITTYMDYVKSTLTIRHKEFLKETAGMFNPDELALKEFYYKVRDTEPTLSNGNAIYKEYSEVRAKVAYLYEQNEYDTYIRQLMEQQTVKRNGEMLDELVARIEEQEETA